MELISSMEPHTTYLKPLNGVYSEYATEESQEYYPKCPAVNIKMFYLYYIPFIIILGLVGNFLAILVFTTTHLRTRSSSYYLAALSCADLTFIITLLIVHCTYIEWIDVFNKEGWCQAVLYVNSICNTLSVWLVVAFTVERFIAVQYPLERPNICTVKRARFTIFILVSVAFITQLYIFFAAGIVALEDGKKTCELLDESFTLMKVINHIDLITTLVVPFLLIVSLNTMIIRKIFQFKDGIAQNSLRKSSSRLSTTLSVRFSSSSRLPNQNDKSTGQSLKECIFSKPASVATSQHNITKMLVITSSVFLILNFPSYLFRFYIFMQNLLPHNEYLWCWQHISMILFYTNFSVNFLLYSMCGITFRRCLIQVLRNLLKFLCIWKCKAK